MKYQKNGIAMLIVLILLFTIIICNYLNPDYSKMSLNQLARCYTSFSEKQVQIFIKKNNLESWPIAKVERLINLNENPHLYATVLLQEVIAKKINKQLLKFNVNGKAYQTAAIFFSDSLESQYRLANGDETAHILEFPETFQVITINSRDRVGIALHNDYSNLKLQFYQGDPRKILSEGYSDIKQLSLKNNQLIIPKGDIGKEQLVFTIIKGPEELYYKKLVWVISIK